MHAWSVIVAVILLPPLYAATQSIVHPLATPPAWPRRICRASSSTFPPLTHSPRTIRLGRLSACSVTTISDMSIATRHQCGATTGAIGARRTLVPSGLGLADPDE